MNNKVTHRSILMMEIKDVMDMVSLIQEICIEKYSQKQYVGIVHQIFLAYHSQMYQSFKNSEVKLK